MNCGTNLSVDVKSKLLPTLQTAMPKLGQTSLRGQTVLGLLWMISQSLGTKLLSVVGQLALAYLLLPEHFALISLAYTVTAFARVLENGGMREVLVHRAAEFQRWGNAAFWLSLSLGLLSSGIIVLASPLAAMVYQSTQVRDLLLCLAVSPIAVALATVPTAKLQNQHRFKTLAGLAAMQGVSQTVATVSFASLGWGAYSFAFGTLVASILNTSLAWLVASTPIKRAVEFEKWGALWNDTFSLSLVGLVTSLIQQADYMMLGIFHSKAQVGYYFFAFSLASQTTQIISSNIAAVFLPVLCKIQSDSERQLRVSVQALRMLAALGIPLSFLQCGLTDAAFHLALPVKWLPAIPCAQILSLGLGVNLLSSLCWCLLKSQGRFRSILALNTVGALLFTIAIGVSAAVGTPILVAWSVVWFCTIYAPFVCWLSIKRIGGTWSQVASIFSMPILSSILALTVGWQLETLVCSFYNSLILRLLVVTFAFCVTYAGLLLFFRPQIVSEVSGFLRHRRHQSIDVVVQE